MSGAVEGEHMYGVVVGIVTSNTLDAMGRLEVRFPGSSDTEIGHIPPNLVVTP
jgi:hypothetical protein